MDNIDNRKLFMHKSVIAITIPLIISQGIIMYFWMFDGWEQSVTKTGLFFWVLSIALGFVCYFSYPRNRSVFKNIMLWTTIFTITLGLFALFVEFAADAM